MSLTYIIPTYHNTSGIIIFYDNTMSINFCTIKYNIITHKCSLLLTSLLEPSLLSFCDTWIWALDAMCCMSFTQELYTVEPRLSAFGSELITPANEKHCMIAFNLLSTPYVYPQISYKFWPEFLTVSSSDTFDASVLSRFRIFRTHSKCSQTSCKVNVVEITNTHCFHFTL